MNGLKYQIMTKIYIELTIREKFSFSFENKMF